MNVSVAPAGRRRWLRLPAHALLIGLTVAAGDMASMPVDAVAGVMALHFLATAFCQWTAAGLLIAAFSDYAVPRWPPAATLAATVLVVAPLATAVSITVVEALGPVIFAAFGHHGWTGLFVGLLFVTARLGIERVERTRRLLEAAEVARSRAETDAAAAQLQALRGQVDPALMLRVMTEVQQRYRSDAAQADRLLDAFVAFLRAAMPAVRSGASTLAAELAVLDAYAALAAQLDSDHAAPRLELAGVLPDAAFPPLALLGLVERLACAGSAASLVRVACSGARTIIELHAPPAPGWLDDAAAYRLRVGLHTAGAQVWHLDIPDPADARSARVVLSFDAAVSASQPFEPVAPGPGALPDPGGTRWTSPALTTPTPT
jgi:hypothetical protein